MRVDADYSLEAIRARIAAIRKWIPPCPNGLDIRTAEYDDSRGRRRISLSLWARFSCHIEDTYKVAQWDCRLSRYESRMQRFADRGMTILDVFRKTVDHRSSGVVLGKVRQLEYTIAAMETATGKHYCTAREMVLIQQHEYEVGRLRRKIKKLKKQGTPCE